MKNDRLIHVSVGANRFSKSWLTSEYLWSDFVARLRTPQRTQETFDEYQQMSKSARGQLKDVGGFVGGTLAGLLRKSNAVTGRDLVTLDLDTIASGETDDVVRKISSLGMAYAVYSTHSHAPYAPRLRVIVPLDRTLTADEYEPVARKLAAMIGIALCDPTTFEPARLMFWPSCSRDAQYVFAAEDKPFLAADGILQMYSDWRDVRAWPQVPGKEMRPKELLAKQQDPLTKKGVVGAFCRVYDIRGALAKYLPNTYADTEHEDRLTYTGGTTVAGAVIYDGGKFLFSHHATDPCSGLLVNAFDLVRLHLYGDQDKDVQDGTPVNSLPSYKAMKKAAMADGDVLQDLQAAYLAEGKQQVASVFQPITGQTSAPEESTPNPASAANKDWLKLAQLEYDSNTGKPKKTRANVLKLLLRDPELAGKIATDEFAMRGVVRGNVPWNASEETRLWTDSDDAGLRCYLEQMYGISSVQAITDALMLVSWMQRFNLVKTYMLGLVWDGVHRVDTLLSDYLGAEDDLYTRAVIRKALAATVARVMTPGTKYDYVPVFVGPQGIGKTTFLRTLGHGWHSDSLQSFRGKEAAEMIQGILINEIGEMTGYSKSNDNEIKQFLSRCEDVYRQPYGRRTEKYPRKGVFFGTCNDHDFLKDPTGSRRFWPVDVGVNPPKKDIWKDLDGEVDQVWAEAVQIQKAGEGLYMDTPELTRAAEAAQDAHREVDVKLGMISEFLGTPVPESYDTMSLQARRAWFAEDPAGEMHTGAKTMRRDKVCALEIWCEMLNGDPKYFRRADTALINAALANMPGWGRNRRTRRYGYCGTQRGFERLEK